MTYSEAFGVLAVALGLINYATYLRAMLAGQTKPHFFTWLVWLATGAIATLAQISGGAGAGAWGNISMVLYFIIVLALCPKYGYLKATRSDWVCLLLALAAIPVWLATDNALYAVIIATLIDALGFIPTIRKTWALPYSESLTSYAWGAGRLTASLLALEQFTLVTALFSGCFLLLNLSFIALTLWRRHMLKKAI
jgi:hypothetical protein